MPFEWFVALRYLREGKTQTALILGAVAIGVAVLVFLSALIGGLQTNLLAKTLGSQSHVTVRAPDASARVVSRLGPGETGAITTEKPSQHVQSIPGYAPIAAEIASMRGVTAVAASVSGSAFLTRGAATKPLTVRGIDAGFDRVVPVSPKIVQGAFRLEGSDVLVGSTLAADLGVGVGDKLRVVTADGRSDVLTIAGVFDLGAKDVNDRWAFVPLREAQVLFDVEGAATAIDLKIADVFQATAIARAIEARTGLTAESWMTKNEQLLLGLRSQASSKTVIQAFITITVALGIASVLIVSVVQKSREIGILRAVGAHRGRVLRVFLIQGGLVGLVGSIAGAGLGGLLAKLFVRFQTNPDGTPMFPVDMSASLVASAVALATSVGIAAAVWPARRAAHLDPAEVIRHG